MKIFLDIDGVICLDDWHKPSIDLLNKLIKETDAKIVFTTDRILNTGFPELECELKHVGLVFNEYDCIEKDYHTNICLLEENRCKQIVDYLNKHQITDNFIILDDLQLSKCFIDENEWINKYFIQTNYTVGLKGKENIILKLIK